MSKLRTIMLEQMGTIVVCFIEGIGLIVGKATDKTKIPDESVPALNSPKVIQIINRQGEPPIVQLSDLFGKHDRIFLIKDPIFMYKLKDENLKNKYIESTTGLSLATKIITPPSMQKQ